MICSVTVRRSDGGRRERSGCGAEASISLCRPRSVLSDQAERTAALWARGRHCWIGNAMPPWDTDGRRGQRGRWRRGRQQSTKWRRKRGPGRARGWRQSAGLPEPPTAGRQTPWLLFLLLKLVVGQLSMPPPSESQSSFHGCKAGLLQDRPTRSVHLW